MVWPMWAIFAWSTVISLVLTGLARRIAPRAGFVDHPDGDRKQHRQATPLLGGAALFLALLSGWLLPAALGWEPRQRADLPPFSLLPLITSACLFCGLGLWDDRWGIRPRTKFACQLAACLPFALWGHTVESIDVWGVDIHFGSWGIAFTIFWLVACANVINLVDGLDGLAGSVGLVIVLTLAVLCLLGGRMEVAVAALAVAGALIGFLVHNWPPAKIFMGDAGSLTVGFIIGALSMESSLKQATGFAFVAPLAIICIPAFDTTMAILRRKLSGRSLGQADRGHIHHCLQDLGLSRLQVLLALTGLSLITATAAVLAVYFRNDTVAALVCLFLFGLLIVGRVFGHLESLLCIAHLREVYRWGSDLRRSLATRMLMARLAHVAQSESQAAWAQVCSLASRRGVQRMDFACVRPQTDAVSAQLVWRNDTRLEQGDQVWEFQVTVQRGSHTVATLRMSGAFQATAASRCSDDLLLLADRFCRAWPIELPEESPAIVAMPCIEASEGQADTGEDAPATDVLRHAA